jgi:hypothetical protein
MRYQEEDGRQYRGHVGRSRRGPTCVMVNPGKRKCVVSDEGMAGGMCCGLGQGLAMTHELVRESGGVGVSKSFPTTLAFISAFCWCSSRRERDCAGGIAGPQMSLSTRGIQQRQMSPKRTPSRDCVHRRSADIGRRDLWSGRGIERQKDGGVALVPVGHRRFPAESCRCWCACR